MKLRIMFGQHKGSFVADLPDDYLQWLSTLADLREPLKSAVDAEIRHRDAASTSVGSLSVPVIEHARRTLAKRFHPDVPGGSHQAMQAVNCFADLLEELVS